MENEGNQYPEPRNPIADNPDKGCQIADQSTGDTFDEFLRVTGAPEAPRGGHADAVAAHMKKIQPHNENGMEHGEHYFGQAGIAPKVSRPRPLSPDEKKWGMKKPQEPVARRITRAP